VVVGFSASQAVRHTYYSRKLEVQGQDEQQALDDGQLHHQDLLISRGRHETKYSITLVRCVI
jgi:hypothetical protein